MFKSTCQHRSFLTLPDLNSIARKTGLLVRQSAKFTPAALLQTLLSSVVTGFASLNQLGTRIAMHIASRIGRATISYEKLYDILAAHLVKARDLTELTNFDPDPRHIKRDNRNRKSPIESGITALT